VDAAFAILLRYGPEIIFLWVFTVQVGVPVPTVPLLLATGALASLGKLNLPRAFLAAIGGSLLADLIWYTVGRRYGSRVLVTICRISLEPDSCARRAKDLFSTRRLRALVIGKFIFEVNAAVAALAGSTRISIGQFLAYDIVSAVIWAGAWCGLGYLLKDGVKEVAAELGGVGPRFLALVALTLGGYLTLKYTQRRRFLSLLRGARITPDELQARLTAGQRPMVVDLRTPLDLQMAPYAIPGALRISTEELEARATAISPDTDIVLYCT
jgi:membrane protein DedA with SNARE-associated domain